MNDMCVRVFVRACVRKREEHVRVGDSERIF